MKRKKFYSASEVHRSIERLGSLGLMGFQLRTLLRPLGTSYQYGTRHLKGHHNSIIYIYICNIYLGLFLLSDMQISPPQTWLDWVFGPKRCPIFWNVCKKNLNFWFIQFNKMFVLNSFLCSKSEPIKCLLLFWRIKIVAKKKKIVRKKIWEKKSSTFFRVRKARPL